MKQIMLAVTWAAFWIWVGSLYLDLYPDFASRGGAALLWFLLLLCGLKFISTRSEK